MAWFSSGCALNRYEVIPQTDKGPQGGQMMLIHQCGSGYVEFVAKPTSGSKWLLQIFGYDKNMKPKMRYHSADVEIVTPDKKETSVTLWNMDPFFWNRGVGILSGKANIEGNAFTAHVWLSHGNPSSSHCIDFNYPFDGPERTTT